MEKVTKHGKARFFSGISYLPVDVLASIFLNKSTSIRSWVAIEHNKDDTTPHLHFVLRTTSSWTTFQIIKWFQGYTDSEGKEINTFVEIVHDRQAIIEYLTHENEIGKYHYSKADIIDHGLQDILPRDDSRDDSLEIIEDMLNGVPAREMCRRYGRDFIYHYASYATVTRVIQQEESEGKWM